MLPVLAPVAYVFVLWWALTGLVLYLDGLPRKTYPITLSVSALLAIAAFFAAVESRDAVTNTDLYIAFTSAVLVWGFLELTYLTGLITGPVNFPCPEDARGLRRFRLALGTSLYHELLVCVALGVMAMLTLNSVNSVAFWTLLVLATMRWSTKLNLFFGVRNLYEKWLPEHMSYLVTYMRRSALNLFFPVSFAAAAIAAAFLAGGALQFSSSSSTLAGDAGRMLVLTLLVLAIIEHVFLIWPFDMSFAWRWGFRSRRR